MGILWRAEDLISERFVTVKELRFPEPLDHMQRRALAARVRREARAMAAVEHPGLARILDVVDDGDRPWVVTELIDAPTLDRARPARRPAWRPITPPSSASGCSTSSTPPPTRRWSTGSSSRRRSSSAPATRCTWPTSASPPSSATPPSSAAGRSEACRTCRPSSPARSRPTSGRSGAVLYFAVEGVPPFSGFDSAAVLEAVASRSPRVPTHAGALRRVLDVTLQKDPSERPSSDELRALLEVAAGPLAPQPAPEPEAEPDTIQWGPPDEVPAPPMGLHLAPSANGSSAANGSSRRTARGPGRRGRGRRGRGRRGRGRGGPTAAAAGSERSPGPHVLARAGQPAGGLHPRGGAPGAGSAVAGTEADEPLDHRHLRRRHAGADRHPVHQRPGDLHRRRADAAHHRLGRVVGVHRPGHRLQDRLPVGLAGDPRRPVHRLPPPRRRRRPTRGGPGLQRPVGRSGLARPRTAVPGRAAELQPHPARAREFQDYTAAEWEFTYVRQGVQLHNLDLGVVTGTKAFTLNFESRASNWDVVRAFMERFEDSFTPPST